MSADVGCPRAYNTHCDWIGPEADLAQHLSIWHPAWLDAANQRDRTERELRLPPWCRPLKEARNAYREAMRTHTGRDRDAAIARAAAQMFDAIEHVLAKGS
jgi:hypothetical protein